MPDCFSKSEVTDFLNFMKLPDGTPVVSDGMMKYLTAYGFFTAPASTKYHGNYKGGLFEHSYVVTKFLLTLTKDNHLRWLKARSPFIVGMFHDLCKIDQYRHPVTGHIEEFNGGRTPIYDEQAWEYNPDTLLKGHGDKSVMLLSQFYTLTREWRHFLKLRCAAAAHPDMRVVANMLLTLLKQTYPVFFEDIEV